MRKVAKVYRNVTEPKKYEVGLAINDVEELLQILEIEMLKQQECLQKVQ